ncbi:MAG: hypothetical protein A4S09_07200 [Proteobacteria bacterium SG_bin7]|nr:MAG: hypothetical protein A4S09_07200 [Proteobacteria bacterium SG_bin7]
MKISLLSTCFGIFLIGCGGPAASDKPVIPGGDAAGGVTSMFAIVAGTLQGTFLTAVREPSVQKNFMQKIFGELFSFANATITSCTASVFSDTCVSGGKAAAYTDCTIAGTTKLFSGSVNLQYSDAGCAFTAAGQTVTRLSELVRKITAYETFTTSTGARTDYRGTVFGGGTRLTKTAGGYELNVLGFNKFYTSQVGAYTHDVSLKTTANITVSDPTATSITFTGGSLEVVDSTHKFVATYVPTNVLINYSTCCYPASGSLAVTYTAGSLTGSAGISFSSTSCGLATLTVNGDTSAVPLWGCQ